MRFLFILLLFFGFNPWLYPAGNISNIRTSFSSGKQRIVIDVDGEKEPAYYVRKSKNVIDITLEKTLSTDNVKLFAGLLNDTNFINKVSFVVLPEESETIISINVKDKTSDDIFSLTSPPRLVIDLEKAKPIKEEK